MAARPQSRSRSRSRSTTRVKLAGAVIHSATMAVASNDDREELLKPNLSALARSTGISLPHLSKIYSGQRTPSLPYANKIATVLGISIDDLYARLKEAS